jgi:hypothetical protein
LNRCQICARYFEGRSDAKFCGATCRAKAFRAIREARHHELIDVLRQQRTAIDAGAPTAVLRSLTETASTLAAELAK